MSGTSRNAPGRESCRAPRVVAGMLGEASSCQQTITPMDQGHADEAGRLGDVALWTR